MHEAAHMQLQLTAVPAVGYVTYPLLPGELSSCLTATV